MQRIKKLHDVERDLATSTISKCGEALSIIITHLTGVTMLRRQETPTPQNGVKTFGIASFRISSERVM
jgi:hypothetical protein